MTAGVRDLVKSALLREVDQQDQKLIPKTASKLPGQKLNPRLAHLEAQQQETALAVDKAKAKL